MRSEAERQETHDSYQKGKQYNNRFKTDKEPKISRENHHTEKRKIYMK